MAVEVPDERVSSKGLPVAFLGCLPDAIEGGVLLEHPDEVVVARRAATGGRAAQQRVLQLLELDQLKVFPVIAVRDEVLAGHDGPALVSAQDRLLRGQAKLLANPAPKVLGERHVRVACLELL